MERRDFLRQICVQSGGLSVAPGFILSGRAEPQTSDLVGLFTEELKLCKVKPEEIVLFYTEGDYAHPEYISATIAAAHSLGTEAFALNAPSSDGPGADKMLRQAFKAANLIVGAIPLYTDAHNDALASGARTLMVFEPFGNLRRLFPNEAVIKRTYAGAKRMARAKQIRITDSAGSDFTLQKEGRKGHAQVGISDRPGRWDHWPSGLVACGPLEDKSEGIYVVQPGDIVLGLNRNCETPIRIRLEKGRITKIEGSYDAQMLREYLEKFIKATDPKHLSDPFRISHAGWGTEHRAQWHVMGMDSESMYGSVMVSIGRNMFDSKDEFAGWGGTNYTPVHVDICCRNKKLYLDGELIVDNDKIVVPELA